MQPKNKIIKTRIRNNPEEVGLTTNYRIFRKTKFKIGGKRLFFQFYQGNDFLYSAKIKSKHTACMIPISNRLETHLSDFDLNAILIHQKNENYTLKIGKTPEKELMKLQVGKLHENKFYEVDLLIHDSILPQKLSSLTPDYQDPSFWERLFDGKFFIPSEKNCAFISKQNGLIYLQYRKIDKSTLEIDAVDVLSPLCIFAIGLSIFQNS